MVAPKNEKVLWVFDFICQQQTDCLQRLLASVYIVAEEEVVRFRGEATVFEQSQQIVVLAVDVTTDLFTDQ